MMYGGMMYFPLKVNLFEEIAMELVEARFGLKGTTAVMKLLCKIYKENGYYLKWDSEQCTLFANRVGKDISEEEMQGIVNTLTEKGFFDPTAYHELGILTSKEIQRVWLDATKRRKRETSTLPYLFEELKEADGKTGRRTESRQEGAQKEGNGGQDADISPQNVCNAEQSKAKESRVKESKATPPVVPPPGKEGEREEETSFDIPEYAYNKQTHNLECLMLELKRLHITDKEEIRKILKLSDYGKKGGLFWKVIHDTNWSKVSRKGLYIIAALAREG